MGSFCTMFSQIHLISDSKIKKEKFIGRKKIAGSERRRRKGEVERDAEAARLMDKIRRAAGLEGELKTMISMMISRISVVSVIERQ